MDSYNIKINSLYKLDFHKQLAFAYLTCERLYPNYVFFSNNFEFGEKQILREAIDFIYDKLFTTDISEEAKIKSYLDTINLNTPFPHDFETIIASSALDSCTAILESLDFMLDKKLSRLNDISTFATDTVDMYISGRDNLDFNTDAQYEYKIINDPLMQRELNTQNGIISYLNKIGELELQDIVNLLELQSNNSKSNIDL